MFFSYCFILRFLYNEYSLNAAHAGGKHDVAASGFLRFGLEQIYVDFGSGIPGVGWVWSDR